MFDQSLFGIAPEAFKAVDVHFATWKPFFMIDFQVPVTAAHQRVIASEFIGINDRPSAYGFNGEVEQGIGRDIFNHFDLYNPITLQNAEYRDFVEGPTATFAFASATKIGFVQFNPRRDILINKLNY